MAESIPTILASRLPVYYEVVEEGLRVRGANSRLWRFLGRDPPVEPLQLTDAFPELVGLEGEIEHMIRSGRGELTIPEVNRSSASGDGAVYFNLSILLDPEAGPRPIVVVEDTTVRSEFHQRLLQSRNENTLLRDKLMERTRRLKLTARRLAKARKLVAEQNARLTMLNDEVLRYSHGLEGEVRMRTRALRESRLEVIRRLAQASEYRDPETVAHVARMSRYSVLLGRRIGLEEERCELLKQASPLHDVGKIAIPDSILLKRGPLTAEEWDIMKDHTLHGHRLLAGSESDFMVAAAEIARSHHERWDGTGYPDGTPGDKTPLFGRICALADAFDALTSRRPYKDPWPPERAWRELERMSGKAYDPELLRAFSGAAAEAERIRAELAEE